jgi:hypothetical protein
MTMPGVTQGSILSHTLYYICMISPKHLVSLSGSLLMEPTSIYMRQTAKSFMISESCSEVSVLLMPGMRAGT